jgi:hypothetical protein
MNQQFIPPVESLTCPLLDSSALAPPPEGKKHTLILSAGISIFFSKTATVFLDIFILSVFLSPET